MDSRDGSHRRYLPAYSEASSLVVGISVIIDDSILSISRVTPRISFGCPEVAMVKMRRKLRKPVMLSQYNYQYFSTMIRIGNVDVAAVN